MNQEKPSVSLPRNFKIVSRIIGVLVASGLNAKQVIDVLEETKSAYLERSWHISSKKKTDQK